MAPVLEQALDRQNSGDVRAAAAREQRATSAACGAPDAAEVHPRGTRLVFGRRAVHTGGGRALFGQPPGLISAECTPK